MSDTILVFLLIPFFQAFSQLQPLELQIEFDWRDHRWHSEV